MNARTTSSRSGARNWASSTSKSNPSAGAGAPAPLRGASSRSIASGVAACSSWAYDRERTSATTEAGRLNLLERFLCFDQIAPGRSNVGTLHYAPNSPSDYEWGVATPVQSCADDWLQFPNLPDPPVYRTMTAQDWGGGDICD